MQQPIEGFPIRELRKPQEGLRKMLAKIEKCKGEKTDKYKLRRGAEGELA